MFHPLTSLYLEINHFSILYLGFFSCEELVLAFATAHFRSALQVSRLET
jgi:hypothetical protein